MLVGITDGVGRRGAACGNHVTVTAKAEAHGDFAGDRAHSSAGNAEQTHLFYVSGMPEPVLLLGEFLRSAAGAEDHANLAFFFHRHRSWIELGIANGFA